MVAGAQTASNPNVGRSPAAVKQQPNSTLHRPRAIAAVPKFDGIARLRLGFNSDCVLVSRYVDT